MEEPSAEDTHRFDNLIPTIVRPPSSSLFPPPHPPIPPPAENSLKMRSSHPSSHSISHSTLPYLQSPPRLISNSSLTFPSSLPAYPSSHPSSNHPTSSFTKPLPSSFHSLLSQLPSLHPSRVPPPSHVSPSVLSHTPDPVCTQNESTHTALHSHTGGGPTQSEGTRTSSAQDVELKEQVTRVFFLLLRNDVLFVLSFYGMF